MKNGDRPINPCPWMEGAEDGLTKREMISAMAMQGVLSWGVPRVRVQDISDKTFSAWATGSIKMADALLKALEESDGK